MGRRLGNSSEVRVTTLRPISSGHLHEAPGGLVGFYADSLDVPVGEVVVLHLMEKVELAADAALVLAAGATAAIDFADQTVKTGATDCGTVFEAKAAGETLITVTLNGYGNPVA